LVAQETAQRHRRTFWFLILLSLAHAMIDINAGALYAFFPTLREQFGLSYTMIGAISMVSSLTSAFAQPFFGWVSDRSTQRWLVPFSLALSGFSIFLIAFMPTFVWVLVAVFIGSVGSAAFHPEGAHSAHNLGGERKAWAMGIYSVGGNIGFAIGPMYGSALLLLGAGLHGAAWGVVLPLILAILVYRLLPRWQSLERETALATPVKTTDSKTNWRGMTLLTLVVIFRSVIHVGIITYLPFYWIDVLGQPSATAPYVQLTYLISGVVGTMVGAKAADRYGTRRTLRASWLLLLPLQFMVPFLSGWLLLVVIFCCGFLLVSTFITTLLMTLEYMPGNLGLASGINLGLAFGMGGVGALLLGIPADRWGVVTTLWIVATMVPIALIISWTLPATDSEKAPVLV